MQTIPNVFFIFASTVLVYSVLSVIGRPVVDLFYTENSISNKLLAPIVGYCFVSFVGLLLSLVFGFSGLTVFISVVFLFAFMIYLSRHKVCLIKNCREIICIFFIGAIASFVSVYGLLIHNVDGIQTVAIPLFDHAKVAITSSILRTGLPILNPFGFTVLSNELHYYFAWYFSSALIAKSLSISAYSAILVNTWLTGIFLFSIMYLISSSLAKGEKYNIKQLIFLVAVFNLPAFNYPVFFQDHHSLETIIYQLPWVPQHVFSGVLVLAMFYMVITSRVMSVSFIKNWKACAPIYFSLAIIITWAFGSSAYVGGCALFTCGLAYFIMRLLSTEQKLVFVVNWLVICIFALLFSSYFIYSYLGVLKPEGTPALGIRVWQSLREPSIFWNVLSYLLIAPLVYFGVQFIAFVTFFIQNKNYCIHKEWFAIAMVSWLVPLVMQSTIANNDFGWRFVIPFLGISGAVVSVILINSKGVLSTILLICLGFQLAQGTNYWYPHLLGDKSFPVSTDLLFKVRDTIELQTEKDARLLFNSDKTNGRNLLLPILINRNLSHYNWSYEVSLAESTVVGREKLPELWKQLNGLFATGKVGDISMMNQLGIDYFVVLWDDPMFEKGYDEEQFIQVYRDNLLRLYQLKN